MEQCKKPTQEAMQKIRSLELDFPEQLFTSSDEIPQQFGLKLYRSMIVKISEERFRKQQHEDRALKQQQEKLEKLTTMDPETLFKAAVNKALQQKANLPKGVDYIALQTKSKTAEQAMQDDTNKSSKKKKRRFTKKQLSAKKASKQGNGKSPGSRQGKKKQQQGGKGAGKGSSKKKSVAAAGAGKGQKKGAGKGKGKGKSSSYSNSYSSSYSSNNRSSKKGGKKGGGKGKGYGRATKGKAYKQRGWQSTWHVWKGSRRRW